MDLIYLVGLASILFVVACLILLVVADADIVTYIAERFGKKAGAEYKGKVVWLTGASSGIGEAIAIELAKCGAKVVLSARRKEELERVKRKCLGASSALKDRDILVLPLDVTDVKSHASSFKTVLDHFGKLDSFISNAGRSQRATWHETDVQVDRDLFELNVFSVISMNRLVVNHFLQNGGGQIVVVSSVAGVTGFPNAGSYSGSKHAIQGYFNTLRMETYGKNIDVTLICPGPVHSNIGVNAFTKKAGEAFGANADEKRMTAERCAEITLVAMANRLHESWIALFPVVPFIYFQYYFPLASAFFLRVIGMKIIRAKFAASKTD